MSNFYKLIDLIETFKHDVTQFSFQCEDIQKQGLAIEYSFAEGLDSYRKSACLIQNKLSEAAGNFEQLRKIEAGLQSRTADNRSLIDGIIEATQKNMEYTRTLLQQWEDEKDLALHSVKVAEKEQHKAENQYNLAYNQLEAAVDNYNAAHTALVFERTNTYIDNAGYSHPRNPSHLAWLEGAAIRAKVDLKQARKIEERSLTNLNMCNEYLQKKSQELEVCQYNVNIMTASVQKSQQAISYAEKGDENADEAGSLMRKIGVLLEKEVSSIFNEKVKCVGEVGEIISKANFTVDNSSEIKQKLDRLVENYTDVVAIGNSKLEERIDLLEEFNYTDGII